MYPRLFPLYILNTNNTCNYYTFVCVGNCKMFKKQPRYGIGSGVFGIVYSINIHEYPNAIKETYRKSGGFNIIEYRNEWDEIIPFVNNHENMVPIFGITILNSNSLLITMELMETNLTQFLKAHQCLALDKSLSILCDVSSAIHYLHSQQPAMFHGNLHSKNIFLTSNLLAKVGDIMPQKLIQKCIDKGTLRNFSPKVISADRSSESLDNFAFGLVVCHVLTKKIPMPQNDDSIDHELNEVERYQEDLDLITNKACRELVIHCLSSSPPPSSFISKSMNRIKEGHNIKYVIQDQ